MTQPTPDLAEKFASLALSHVAREYPNKMDHVLDGPADSGIDQNSKEIGRAAVQTLISLIHHNERGIPQVGVAQIGVLQLGAKQAGPLQVGAGEVGVHEGRLFQVAARQRGCGQVGVTKLTGDHGTAFAAGRSVGSA